MYIYLHIYICYRYKQKDENGKWKPRQFSFIRLPLAHNANRSPSFIRLLTKKQTKVIRLQTDLLIYANDTIVSRHFLNLKRNTALRKSVSHRSWKHGMTTRVHSMTQPDKNPS
jgi:hypothetical protein